MMKKTYLPLFLMLLMASGAFAQKGFHLGVEGSYNLTFIVYQETYGQTELDYALTTAGAGGVVAGYNFDKHFGLQIEGLYGKLGQNYSKQTVNQSTIYRTVELNYYHFPFLLKYSGGGDYAVRFYVMAGPQLSMLDKATISYKNNPGDNSIDATNRFVKNTWDAVFELGSDFTVYKALYASTGLRFNYGLEDINAPDFRQPNHNGIYNASKNAWGGVNIGLHYVFGYQDHR